MLLLPPNTLLGGSILCIMADEIHLEGNRYISSKRASELSGYTQDYIGQLARGSLINARRVGGLWYVLFESLEAHKTKAESYTPEIPIRTDQGPVSDTVVSFDGKDYISASRAGKITGYHQDYVAQLARSGKVESRQVGNRWFVNRAAIEGHRREKDALLGAVQVESVGIRKPESTEVQSESDISTFYTYSSEFADTLPQIKEQRSGFKKKEERKVAQSDNNRHPIPIKVTQNGSKYRNKELSTEEIEGRSLGISMFYKLFFVSVVAVVLLLLIGLFSLKSGSRYVFEMKNVAQLKGELAAGGTFKEYLAGIAEKIEKLLGREETYVRAT